ncbi:ABC transporter permease [Lampropedia puyangensis]|nr:ABC transporter permease [Lampropedia puyangensis]
MTTASASSPSKHWLLLAPATAFIGVLFLAPVLQLLIASVIETQSDGSWAFTLARYESFFADSYNLRLMLRTLGISLATVLASLVLAFPVALYMRELSPRKRAFLAILLLSPLLTSLVVRTLAWVVLLGPKGLLNGWLAHFGLPAVTLMYNVTGVVIGLTHVYFGYMLLCLMTSVLKIDNSLLLAAQNLGASRWRVIWHVILPLCTPGIVAGSILVFTMSASAYVTPDLLGGTNMKVMASEIYDLAINYLEWREAATVAAILFIAVWAVVAVAAKLGERPNLVGGGKS